MKKMSDHQMEVLEAGGPGRTCMILGGLATIAGVFGLYPAAVTVTAGAAIYGCFN